MGAGTLAFVPVRDAVLSEGATEIVLLPTLFREATGLKALGFQVAPASSEAPAAHIAGLDREATKVIWVVDGDEDGRRTRSRLQRAGIPNDRIRVIGGERSPAVLEDFLRPAVYAAAINAELARSGHVVEVPLSILTGTNRPRAVEEWCNANNVPFPSKVSVANRVLDLRQVVPALLSGDGRTRLRALHTYLVSQFAST